MYPIPADLPVEEWPLGTGSQTVFQWQTNDNGSDRHAIMVAAGGRVDLGKWATALAGTNWVASNGAKFNLNRNGLRQAGWTSGDAAGLPMFSALVRYDEAERGMVEHACRIVVAKIAVQLLHLSGNALCRAVGKYETNLPAMGRRVRLKAAFVIPANWTKEEKPVLLGLKKYGAMVADNGNFFSISVTPDDRWPANCFDHFTSISITNFEVIQTTGANEGPRSPGAPVAKAGPDQSVGLGNRHNYRAR